MEEDVLHEEAAITKDLNDHGISGVRVNFMG